MSLYATGGTVQQIGSKRVHFFTTVGSASLVCSGTGNAEILVIAGGGAGGSDRGGGGGGGGYIYNSSYGLSTGTYSVTVGAGGVPVQAGTPDGNGRQGGNGGNSSFTGLTVAVGGGGGGGCSGQRDGLAGGSGGGASQFNGAGTGGTATSGQGNIGGNGNEGNNSAGGGGGAGSSGTTSGANGGNGGSGINFSISGSIQTYCSGGGGGKWTIGTAGTFGIGGTGAGNGSATVSGNGSDATYYGCGGGGSGVSGYSGGATCIGGYGYQGIVIVSYDYTPNPFPPGPNGEAVYFSATSPSQATVTVAYNLSIPGALYRVIAYNPNGVASNPVTFTITNSLAKPAFLNPGPQTFVGGGSFSILQTAQSSGIAWTISPTTAVTLSSATDAGVTVNVSNGIAVTSPTNYTLTATDSASQVTSQTFTIQNTFNAPAFVNPGTQSFTNGGSLSISQTAANTGQLGWSISPTTGVTLSGASTNGVTVTVSISQPISGVTYTLTATNPTPTSCVQSFSITNTITALYSFSTFTFTPVGATGPTGPTTLAGYSGTYPGVGTSYALSIGAGTRLGMQLWYVPITGSYQITATGAGKVGATFTSYGRSVRGTYNFTGGQVLVLLVGQSGLTMFGRCDGGCGGSYVVDSSNNPIIIAGGAGGNGVSQSAGENGRLTTSGGAATFSSYNPDGGAGGETGKQFTGSDNDHNSAGGGGFNTGVYNGVSGGGGDGQTQTSTNSTGGKSFLNGGTGGYCNTSLPSGGFGGGGATHYFGGNPYGGGGGGGYSGGGGGAVVGSGTGGGGGGSYGTTTLYGGTTITDLGTTNSGQGSIIITYINPNAPVLTNPGTQSLNTLSSSQTITVPQTTSTSSTGTITWTYSTLPSGMTVQSSSGSQIVFVIAQNTTISTQNFTVTATAANAPTSPASVTFSLTAFVGTPGTLAGLTSGAKTSAKALFGVRALLVASATILTVRRASDNVTVNVIADSVGNYTVSSGGTYATWIGASTGYVTQWWDQSGSANHATQSTTASQPIFDYTNKQINFRTSAWFSMPNGTIPTGNTNYTFVLRHNTITTGQNCFIGAGGYGTVDAVNAVEINGGGYLNYWWGDDMGAGGYIAQAYVTFKYDNTVGRTSYRNGTQQATNNSLAKNTTAVNNTIGADWRGGGAGVFLNGELYYVQIYSTTLSDADRGVAESVPIT